MNKVSQSKRRWRSRRRKVRKSKKAKKAIRKLKSKEKVSLKKTKFKLKIGEIYHILIAWRLKTKTIQNSTDPFRKKKKRYKNKKCQKETVTTAAKDLNPMTILSTMLLILIQLLTLRTGRAF